MEIVDPLHLRMRWYGGDYAKRRAALIAGSCEEGARDWRGIDLRGARVRRGWGGACQLDFAQLDGACIEAMDLEGASFAFVSAVESRWVGVILVDGNFGFANFAGASLAEAKLDRASLVGASFAGADLRAAGLRGVDFRGCDLESAWLAGAKLDRDIHRASGWRSHSREVGCATFADVMENNGYMAILSLRRGYGARVAEGIAWGAPQLDAEIAAALGQTWRYQIVAAAVAVLGADRIRSMEGVVDALWGELRRGSWASPQLAVACALLDTEFGARAGMGGDGKMREALDALSGRWSHGTGAHIAMTWRANVEKFASAAARARWSPRGHYVRTGAAT